jgi:hypothetical protein
MNTGTVGHLDQGTVAAYLLGGLGRAETAVHKRHLLRCDACREQLAALAEVREKLSLVPASLVLEDPALAGHAVGRVPATPRRSTVPRWHRSRGLRRRWLPAAAIAVATVVGAVLIPVLVSQTGAPGNRQPPATVVMFTGFDVSTHVTATMRLRPGPTASTFDLRLTGVPAQTTLRVVADRSDGSTVLVGRWQVPAQSASTIFELFGTVDVKISDLTGFHILTSGGDVLVNLAMPEARGSASPSP